MEQKEKVSKYCKVEKCPCGSPAVHKIEETIFDDLPGPRHPYVQYVCQICFDRTLRPYLKPGRTVTTGVSKSIEGYSAWFRYGVQTFSTIDRNTKKEATFYENMLRHMFKLMGFKTVRQIRISPEWLSKNGYKYNSRFKLWINGKSRIKIDGPYWRDISRGVVISFTDEIKE